MYRTDDDTIDDNTGELRGDPGPDEIIGTDDDVVLILGGDGLPCTDDDTLACGPDEQPGTADDGLNLGPDGRAGTADDNTTLVQPDTSLQTPGRRVTLSGGDSTASSGRRIVSYSWRQICLNPDAYGYHKVVAYHDLVKGIGYCGVDVALSSDRGRTVTLTTPALPAMVKRSHRETIGRRVETVTEEATVSLYYMLTVTDSAGGQDYALVSVDVAEAPEVIPDTGPIAKAVATYTGSRARQGSIASYQWTQVSGTEVELTNADRSRATFTTPTGQTADMAYSFLLTVTDTVGSQDFAVVKIGVRARPTVAVDFTTSRAQSRTWSAGDVIGLRGDIGGITGEELAYTWSSMPASLNNVAWSGDLTGTVDGPGGRVTNGFTLPNSVMPCALYAFTLSVSDGVSRPAGIVKRTLRVNPPPDGCTSGRRGCRGSRPCCRRWSSKGRAWPAPAPTSPAPGESVTLQGTDSINPHGEWWRMRHQWTQLSGPTVTLTHPQAFQPAPNFGDPRFTIPADA